MQKESTKELKMLQEESSRKIQGLEENIKVLQKESSKEAQGLNENISEIMTFLKNEWKSPSVLSEIIEQPNDSGTNNRTISDDIISTSNLCISSEARSSPINSPDLSTVINHNIINLDISAIQTSMVDQTQLSSMESIKEQNTSMEGNPNSEFRRSKDSFTSPIGIIYMRPFMMMFNMGTSRIATIPGQDSFISTKALSRLQFDQNKIVKIADFKKNCFIFKDHIRGGYVCFANM